MSRANAAVTRRVRVGIALATAVSLLGLALSSLNGEYQRGLAAAQSEAVQPVALDVALVNEDRGHDAGTEPVNLGRGYVKQIESDGSAAWHVVSRGVAERGLGLGAYDLIVIIPTEFSAKLLDLEATDPSPIGITYQVNGDGSTRREAAADRRGREIVAQLNSQLVDMYVASILANLRAAQDGVRVVVDGESEHVEVLAAEVDPGYRAFGVDLGGLTEGTAGALGAQEGLGAGIGGLGDDLLATTEDATGHDATLAELLAAREAGTLTYEAFLESLLALDARLLSDEIQALYDDLVAVGGSLRDQLTPQGPAEQQSHADLVALLVGLAASQEAGVADRVAALDALDAVGAYGDVARQVVDADDDGEVSLLEVLLYGRDPESVDGPEFLHALRAEIEAQIAVLPYRDPAALGSAVRAGAFGHAGGQVAHLADQIAADLATVRTWPDHDQIGTAPEGVVGADLDEVIAALDAALTAEPEPEPEPGTPDLAPVAEAAARYGAEVTRIADAYRRAALLVVSASACETTCGLAPGTDVTAAVHAVLASAVGRHVESERAHLAAAGGGAAAVAGAAGDLVASLDRLRATTGDLATSIDAQLDALATTRESMAQIRDDERTAAQSVAESDAITATVVGEARALTASSERLALAAQAGADEAVQVQHLIEGLGADVAGLVGDAADLDGRSALLTAALSGHLEGSQEFAESFGGVLSNAHSSGVLNEALLRFLVEPVSPHQRDAVASSDVARPFPWVLITFALCFMCAYLLARVRHAHRSASAFDRARAPWLRSSARATGLAASVGLALGAGLAWASARDLGVPRESQVAWGVVMVLIAVALTLLTHWLVRQWRSAGVGACVLLLVGYVFVSDAVGGAATSGLAAVLADVGPLSRAEAAMRSLLGTDPAGLVIAGPLAVAVLGAVVLNLLVQDDLRRFVPRRWRRAARPAVSA